MFAIVHSLVLLRDTHNILYFLSLSFIPLSFIYAGLGYYAVSRIIMVMIIIITMIECVVHSSYVA